MYCSLYYLMNIMLNEHMSDVTIVLTSANPPRRLSAHRFLLEIRDTFNMKLLALAVLMSFVIGTIGDCSKRGSEDWTRGIPDCRAGGPSWYHVDNAHCDGYYQCYDGVVRHYDCPPGELLKLDSNDVPKACLPPWEVDCGHRPYHPTVAPFRLIRLNVTIQAPNIADKDYDIIVPQIPLIYIMRLLAQEASNPDFSFESVSSPFLGEFIVTINGLTTNSTNQYWSILNPVKEIQLGASSYIPNDQEHIVFRVTSY